MSRAIKLLVAAVAIALVATITAVIAYDQGRVARQDRTVRYDGAASVGFRARPGPYRLRLTPDTVITLGPGPNCWPSYPQTP